MRVDSLRLRSELQSQAALCAVKHCKSSQRCRGRTGSAMGFKHQAASTMAAVGGCFST